MNLTLASIALRNVYSFPPFLVHHSINIIGCRVCKSFSSFLYCSNFKSLIVERSKFQFFITKIAIIDEICVLSKDTSSNVMFCNTDFCNVVSTGNGGCFLAKTSNVTVTGCSFYNCTTTSGYGGAYFVQESCLSHTMNKTCFILCKADQSHGFRVECSNVYVNLFLVTQCYKEQIGLYGSFLFMKKNIANDFNSTRNLIDRHGTGFYYFQVVEGQTHRAHISECFGRGIEVLDGASNCEVKFHNVINNTCTEHGIVFSYSSTNHWRNCLFVANKNTFLYTQASFFDCRFDFEYSPNSAWISGNLFSVASYTTISVPNQCPASPQRS